MSETFDEYCIRMNIQPGEQPAAFGAWLNSEHGWDDKIDVAPDHGGNSGLCFEDHFCPTCETGGEPCEDLFQHPLCGLVACNSDDPS